MGTVTGKKKMNKMRNLFHFPRQVWFCLGLRAAPCPSLFCDGGLKMEQCIGPSSNSCGPWGWRTPPCSLVPLPRSSQPPRNRETLHHSVSKREGKLVIKSSRMIYGTFLPNDTDSPLLNRIVYIVQFLGKTNIGMVYNHLCFIIEYMFNLYVLCIHVLVSCIIVVISGLTLS